MLRTILPLIALGLSTVVMAGDPWGNDPLARAVLAAPTPESGSLRAITDPDHGSGVELITSQRVDNPWNLQLSLPTIAPVQKDALLVVEFWIRAVRAEAESGEANTTLVIERKGEPWTKSVETLLTIPGDGTWRKHVLGGRSAEDYVAGGAQLNFQLGTFRPQIIQIAGLTARDLGPNADATAVPFDRITYPGRAADALWRAKAAAQIERHRKQDLAIIVRDAQGNLVPSASIQVATVTPAFGFGTAVDLGFLLEESPDAERYRQWILAHCTRVVAENHMKWPWFTPGNSDRAVALRALDWFQRHGLTIHGHVLHWPSWRNSPNHLPGLSDHALADACGERIVDALRTTAAYPIREWDVVNEAYTNRDLLDRIAGQNSDAHADLMAKWFALARQHFAGELLYNDFCHLVNPGRMSAHKQFAEDLIKALKHRNAPITGYGIQGHIGGSLGDPALVMAELDRLDRELGVDLHLTELDVNLRDETCQADFQRDFMTACFASPRVKSLMIWGFWESRHWIPAGALYRADWSAKPVATAVERLVASWRTNEAVTSDAVGIGRVRAFKGSTRVTVTLADGDTIERMIEVGDAPVHMTITVGER